MLGRIASIGVVLSMSTGCTKPDPGSAQARAEATFAAAATSPQGTVAAAFARLLVAGDFVGAAAMLAPSLQATVTASSLAADYARMIAYGEGPAAQVQPVTVLDTWPDRQPGDLGWAYVAISGPGFEEAVTVVVTTAGTIRTIEWGRP